VTVCKREAGEPSGVRHWKKRVLPEPHAKLAIALIADSEEIGEKLGHIADHLQWRPRRDVSVLADGAAWIWKQSRKHLPQHEGNLDVWHMMEHLHETARTLHGPGEQATRWAELQRARIFRDGALRYLKEHLLPQVKAARREGPGGEKAKSLRALLGYLWSHRGRMRYRDRLRRGLPIGSGQIEGVCKNTLNRRLRLNNARWCPEHAQDMAALCCLHASDQWESYWTQAA